MSRPPAPGIPWEAAVPCQISFYATLNLGLDDLQSSVDDALDLVHDVVLRKQVLQIPGEDSFEVLSNCNSIERKK